MLAFLAPFVMAIFRTAGKKPNETVIRPPKRVAGQYLPRQRVTNTARVPVEAGSR
jgi:hypothetical protein